MTFFLFLSCAPEYNLKLDTITGALQSLESQNVQIDAYCGFMMNASEDQYSVPERTLGNLFVRPDYCQEAETDNFECNWYPVEESFFDILEYDLNSNEEIVYDYGLQHQDSFEDRMLLSILGAELPVDTVYRLIGTVKKRGFVFDNSIANQTVDAFLENSPQEQQYAYISSFKLTEWTIIIYEESQIQSMQEGFLKIDGTIYQPTNNRDINYILYPCLQPLN